MSCLIRLSTWLVFLVPRPHYCAADAFRVAWSERVCACLVRVECVSASSPKCIVREGLGSISQGLFGNFRAEIVALHIIQPPHDFRTEDCPCNRKTLQLCSQSTSFYSETTGNRATEKVLGTRLFTLQLQSRPAIISVMAELFNFWKKNKTITRNIAHHQEKNFQVFWKAGVSPCQN